MKKTLHLKLVAVLVFFAASVGFSVSQAQAQSCHSFVGNPNGINDNTLALNNALTALGSTGGCIAFPPENTLSLVPSLTLIPHRPEACP
jgi:hypothetical protein